MRKQKKAKKHTTDAQVPIEEQPGGYKKSHKEKQEAYSKIRDTFDAMRAASPKP
jgi:hypothetical protein